MSNIDKGNENKKNNLIKWHEEILNNRKTRDKNIHKIFILDKVKKIKMLSDDIHVTVEMTADYYEVGIEAIKSLIKDHRDELVSDGLEVLQGDELRFFKNLCGIKNNSRILTIIPRRAILRFGQLLRESQVAIAVRDYLLDTEIEAKTILSYSDLDRVINRNSTKQGNQEIKMILRDVLGANCPKHFEKFFLSGYKGSCGVDNLTEYRILKGLPENAKPLDHMCSLELAGYKLRTEMTKDIILSGNVTNLPMANEVHKSTGTSVADLVETITGRTIISLRPKKDIKLLRRDMKIKLKRLKNENKKKKSI